MYWPKMCIIGTVKTAHVAAPPNLKKLWFVLFHRHNCIKLSHRIDSNFRVDWKTY